MANRTLTLLTCFALLALAAGARPAWAGDHGKCCKIDVDIDELDADLYPDGDGWLLTIRYEVDVEDACEGEQLLLNFEFSHDDCRIRQADGRPLLHSIRLDHPTKCDDDEQTFESSIELRLTGDEVGDPDEFEVHAAVTRPGGSCALDKDSTSADVHRPHVVVQCEPRVVEVRQAEPVVVEVRPPCDEPVVYVRKNCRSAVVRVARPVYVHVGVGW